MPRRLLVAMCLALLLPAPRAFALHDLQARRWPSLVSPASEAPRVSTLRGRVLGFGNSLPVEDVLVEVEVEGGGWVAGLRTDGEGRFEVEVPAGRLRLVLKRAGYETWSSVEEVDWNKTVEMTFRLRPPESDEVIVVYGDRPRTEVTRQVFSKEELREIPGSFGDPVRALQSLPGVARPNSLEGNLVVRGAEGSNTGFYVDDLPVPFLFHLLLGKSVINPAFVDDVEFYPGGMPSRFGEVLQAAVNIRTGTEPVEGIRGLLDLNVLDVGGAVEARRKDWGWTVRFAARHSWLSLPIALASGIAVLSQGGDFSDASYLYLSYWDLFLSAEKKTKTLERWSADLIASKDGLYVHMPESIQDPVSAYLPFDPSRFIDAGFGRLRLRRQAGGEAHRTDTWIAGGPQRQQNLLGNMLVNKEGPYYGRVEGWSLLGHREDTFALDAHNTALLGAHVTLNRLSAQDYMDAFENPLGIPSTRDTQVGAAAFGEWQWRPGSWFLAPGLRASFHHFNGMSRAEPEPRFTARRSLAGDWNLKASVGRYTQIPPLNQYAEGIGNPDLTLMRAWQTSWGVEWRRGALQIDSSLYGSVMRDLVVQDSRVDFHYEDGVASETTVPIYRNVLGWAYGWEGLLRLDPTGPWWGWLALTLGRSVRQDPSTGEIWPGDYDQPMALTLLASYEAPRAWRLSGRFRLTSGHPFTPYSGAYDPLYDVYNAYPGEMNGDRYPTFHQLDLRAEKTWRRPRRDWRFYVDVFNAYNARNPFAAMYNYDYSELVPMISIPILPTVGLEVTF